MKQSTFLKSWHLQLWWSGYEQERPGQSEIEGGCPSSTQVLVVLTFWTGPVTWNYISLIQDLGDTDNKLAQEKAPTRGAMNVAFPCVQTCKAMPSLSLKFDISCISSHEILYLTSWSELSQILKKWVLWVILWYFSVFPKLCVLAVDGCWLHKLQNTSLWPILATHNLLYTITSRTQALTIRLGLWKTHS